MDKQEIVQLKKRLAQCRRNDTVEEICRFLRNYWRRHSSGNNNEKIPSVRWIAEQLGVARQSAAKVYNKLEKAGVISRKEGSRIWHLCHAVKSFSRCIGFVLPVPFLNYFAQGSSYDIRFGLFAGITERAAELGYSVQPVYLPEDPEDVDKLEKMLPRLHSEFAGLIHFGERGYASDPVLSRIFDFQEIPQVSMGCEVNRPWIGSVTFDGNFVMRTLVNTLRELGHINLCVLYPGDGMENDLLRYTLCEKEEIHRALEKSGFRKERLTEIITTPNPERKLLSLRLKELLNRANAPTAFWCRSEEVAFLLIECLQKQGVRVPEGCSVVGFDDVSFAAACKPELTTFHYPLFDTGAAAVEKIDDFVQNGIRSEHRITRLLPPLIMRKTLGMCNQEH